MAESHRKRRFIGKLNGLLDKSIADGHTRTGIELARLISTLEGWTAPIKGSSRPALAGAGTDQVESGLSDTEWERLMAAAGKIPAESEPEDSE